MRISDWSSDVCSSDLARSINDRQEQASDSVRMVGQPSQGAVQKFSAKRMIAASFKFLARAIGMGEPHNILMAPVRIAFAADPLLRFGLETFGKNGIEIGRAHV